MKKLYFVFTRSSGVTGKLIGFFSSHRDTKEIVTHVLMIYWSEDFNCWATIEALADGIFPRPFDRRREYIARKTRSIYSLEVGENLFHQVIKESSWLHYDFLLTIGQIFPGVVNKFLKSYGYVPILNNVHKFNCSELFTSRFEKMGLDGFHKSMTPNEFLYAMTTSKLFRVENFPEMLNVFTSNLRPD
jgi:hypothetical protein